MYSFIHLIIYLFIYLFIHLIKMLIKLRCCCNNYNNIVAEIVILDFYNVHLIM